MHRVTAVVVNWNSGDDLARVVTDLSNQSGVDLSTIVVDNASTDDSVDRALAAGLSFRLIRAGANLGYTGGNEIGAREAGPDAHVFIVNPDVSLSDRSCLSALSDALAGDSRLAAVAPAIEVAPGKAEYLDSVIELDRAVAEHRRTNAEIAPSSPLLDLSWIDGAAWLIRAEARAQVGLFDERFFLLYEEVDWCIRVRAAGWKVGLCTGARVGHARSSSFAGSHKGSYYYWRNLYLLCQLHAASPRWRWHYLRRLVGFATRPVSMRSGHSVVSARGAFDALRGRYGPAPEDQGA